MTVRYRVWGGNGKPDVWRTLEQLEARWDWRMLHPEVRRRLLATFVLSDHAIGFLSGARSFAEQAEQYRLYGPPRFAPPERSYHVETAYTEPATGARWAVAADLIGALPLLDSIGPMVGLVDFSDVNNEPWHVQPTELPRGRIDYRPGVHLMVHRLLPADWLDVFTPPATPAPTPTGDDDMARLIRFRGYINAFLIGAGTPIHCTGELVASYRADGVPALLLEPHAELMNQMQLATHTPALTAGGPQDRF